MKRKDDGRKPSARRRLLFVSALRLSLTGPRESCFHVESLLNGGKEEKGLLDGEYLWGDIIAFYALLLIVTTGKEVIGAT